MVWPILRAVQFSVYRWKGFGPLVDFVGLRNYDTVLHNEVFTDTFAHNITIVVLSILIQLPLGLGIALLLGRSMWGQGVLGRSSSSHIALRGHCRRLVPAAPAAVRRGRLAAPLRRSPRARAGVLGTPDVALYTVFAVLTWKYLGLAVLLLAGLQGVPDAEAAQIDQRLTVADPAPHHPALLGPTMRVWAFTIDDRLAAVLRHDLDPHRRRPCQRHHDDGDVPGSRGDQAPELRHRRRHVGDPLHRRLVMAVLYQVLVLRRDTRDIGTRAAT
ncbi:MAG: sugar ABC transporter permease [Nocardioidaceae bacterium]